jgi:hypothetical protein
MLIDKARSNTELLNDMVREPVPGCITPTHVLLHRNPYSGSLKCPLQLLLPCVLVALASLRSPRHQTLSHRSQPRLAVILFLNTHGPASQAAHLMSFEFASEAAWSRLTG